MLIYDFLTYRVLRRVTVYALFGIGCLPLLAAYNPATNVDIHIWMLKIVVEKRKTLKRNTRPYTVFKNKDKLAFKCLRLDL